MVVFKSINENEVNSEILEMNFCQYGLYVEIRSTLGGGQLTNFIIPNDQLEELKQFIIKGE